MSKTDARSNEGTDAPSRQRIATEVARVTADAQDFAVFTAACESAETTVRRLAREAV